MTEKNPSRRMKPDLEFEYNFDAFFDSPWLWNYFKCPTW